MSSERAHLSRKAGASKPSHTCDCGRVLRGNGAIQSHIRACEASLAKRGYPMPKTMRAAVQDEYRVGAAHIIRYVEREVGQLMLERRAAGNKEDLRWIEYRDLVWKLAEEALR